MENSPVGPDGKVGGVDNTAPLFPVCADLVGVLGHFQTIADRKRRAGFLNHLFGFVGRINGKSDDVGVLLLEFLDMRLEVGYLPDAVRSPDAAIENNNGILAFEIRRNFHPAAVGR